MSDPLIPVRKSLVGECVRVIKTRIRDGEWSGHLPGERRIASTLQVGRDTVRLALQQLEKEGVISSAERGARRTVLAGSGRKVARALQALRVGMLSTWNLELLPQPTLLEVDRIRMALAAMGGSLVVMSPPWYRSARPAKRLRELLREQTCHAWVLHRSSAEVQQCMEREGVPCLIRGYPHEGVDLPHLDVDWHGAARHAAGVLWRLGHRRVSVLMPPDMLRGVVAAVQGMADLGEEGFEVEQVAEDGTVEGIVRALEKSFGSERPPTAVIATRPRQAATALSWLQAAGRLVPGDVSLMSLGDEPFLEHLFPELSRYTISPELVARRLVRRIEVLCQGQRRSGGSPWLTPEFQRGSSIGPAKG